MVEHQPSKLDMRVRFPLPAPCSGRLVLCVDSARIAQEVEHFIGNEEVSGSTPDVSTKIRASGMLLMPAVLVCAEKREFDRKH